MHAPIKWFVFTAISCALAGCGTRDADTSVGQAPDPDTTTVPAPSPAEPAPAPPEVSHPAPRLQAALRDLWHGHIVHARDYALAVHAHNDDDAKQAADDVVANARQISAAVAGFYGKSGGDRMMELLGGHWGAVKALTDARANADNALAGKAAADMAGNAGEIAKFLDGANPNLPEDTVRGLMLAHGAHHSQQVQQIMAGDMQGESITWTAMQQHMDMIADALAGAIARQFPDKTE